MGNLTYVFERVERKFLLTPSQYEGLMRVLPEYMQADQYGESTILSLYLDTADSLLIRRSLEKPVYKEKLRLRSYGVPGDGDNVFLEMKKKVQGVVYKRRICLPLDRAMACLAQGTVPAAGGQIGREIAYMLRRYRADEPSSWGIIDRQTRHLVGTIGYAPPCFWPMTAPPTRSWSPARTGCASPSTAISAAGRRIWTCAWGRRANRCSRPACV